MWTPHLRSTPSATEKWRTSPRKSVGGNNGYSSVKMDTLVSGSFGSTCDRLRGRLVSDILLNHHLMLEAVDRRLSHSPRSGMMAWLPSSSRTIKSYFESTLRSVDNQSSRSVSEHLASYAQKPDLPRVVEEEEVEETEPKEVLSPLEKFPVEDFELLMVMSGTSRPKAVVLDPMGTPWVFARILRWEIRGLVQAITQYSIVVSEPGQTFQQRLPFDP